MHTRKPFRFGGGDRHAAVGALTRVQVQLVNGRVVAKSIADPDVQVEVQKLNQDLRSNVEKLRRSYIEQGILASDGKLAKRYGG